MGYDGATYEEVRQFLDQMKSWLSLLGGYVIFDNRDKNVQFMVDMDWNKSDKKKEWLLKLEPEDYFEGPEPNEIPGLNPVWKFGKRIEGHLCYIKIFLIPQNRVYCISFHFAEHNMYLPLMGKTETV